MVDENWKIRTIANQPEVATAIAKLTQQILQNPLQLQQLGDRVYELLQQDLRIHQERSRGYGKRF
ncbi:MAG: hypothetical protein KME11_07405 [Timaviella obliquedivisa GSE-PSE-MK23-08B]|jgi:hypothetical protein|nr:hypothetical protein [Timaviella obliquedivisa GSE-PSE-MK23-08B]